jgi:hypothetical protein
VARSKSGRSATGHVLPRRFTLPAVISAIAWYNQALIYGVLSDVAAENLRTSAADPKHLGAQIGATVWG